MRKAVLSGKTENSYKFINFVCAFLIFFNCAAFVGCQTKEQKSSELREKCREFSNTKNPEKAIECFERVITLDAQDGAYIYLADEYKQLNLLDKAEEAIKIGIELRPNRPSAHQSYGEILERKNDLRGALEQHKLAVELDPKIDIYWIYLALVQEKLGKNEDAVNSYNQALTIASDETLVLYRLGKLYEIIKKPAEAVKAYEKLLKIKTPYDDAEERLRILKAAQPIENQTQKQMPKKSDAKKKSAEPGRPNHGSCCSEADKSCCPN